MAGTRLQREKTGLMMIDVQEKLFRQVERPCEILHAMKKVAKGFQTLGLPIVVSEQYPQGLGATVKGLRDCFDSEHPFRPKTSFSCLGDAAMKQQILEMDVDQWVLAGIEAHVCVLQTARDLIQAGKQVVVLNDAISSRSIYDFSTAIAEMRDLGARVSSTETVLFELLGDSKAKEFKQISELIR